MKIIVGNDATAMELVATTLCRESASGEHWDWISLRSVQTHPRDLWRLVQEHARKGVTYLLTMNPYVLDTVTLENVLVVYDSFVAPLSAHPDADRFRRTLETGEFWTSVGEEWVRGVQGETKK